MKKAKVKKPKHARVRTVFHMDKVDRNAIDYMSSRTGIPVSELLREAARSFLKKKPEK